MQLEFVSVSKSFGSKEVLKNLSLCAQSSRAFGLLGRNGAGKTTSIRLLMGVFEADQGQLLLDGKPLSNQDVRIGYLPEEKGMYPKQSVLRQLCYFGRLRGLAKAEAKRAAERWLERLSMESYRKQPLDTLSKGNQQKIQLACALLTDPQLVILDEPFSGLDPVNSLLLKEVVLEQVAKGKIVFFSSHQMSYVASFCDDVAILHHGQTVFKGEMSDLRKHGKKDQVLLRLSKDGKSLSKDACLSALLDAYNRYDLVLDLKGLRLQGEAVLAHLAKEEDRAPFLKNLLDLGYNPEYFGLVEPSLEEIFVHYTADKDEQSQAKSLRLSRAEVPHA